MSSIYECIECTNQFGGMCRYNQIVILPILILFLILSLHSYVSLSTSLDIQYSQYVYEYISYMSKGTCICLEFPCPSMCITHSRSQNLFVFFRWNWYGAQYILIKLTTLFIDTYWIHTVRWRRQWLILRIVSGRSRDVSSQISHMHVCRM